LEEMGRPVEGIGSAWLIAAIGTPLRVTARNEKKGIERDRPGRDHDATKTPKVNYARDHSRSSCEEARARPNLGILLEGMLMRVGPKRKTAG
jgi:hypothetical protein